MAFHGNDLQDRYKWYQSPHLGLSPAGYGGISGGYYNHYPAYPPYTQSTNAFVDPYLPPTWKAVRDGCLYQQQQPSPPPLSTLPVATWYSNPYGYCQPPLPQSSTHPPQHSRTALVVNGHFLPQQFPYASQTNTPRLDSNLRVHSPIPQSHLYEPPSVKSQFIPTKSMTTQPIYHSSPYGQTSLISDLKEVEPTLSDLKEVETTTPPPIAEQPIVHSHLWRARCKQDVLKSTAVTGGVKKPHRLRLGTFAARKLVGGPTCFPKVQQLLQDLLLFQKKKITISNDKGRLSKEKMKKMGSAEDALHLFDEMIKSNGNENEDRPEKPRCYCVTEMITPNHSLLTQNVLQDIFESMGDIVDGPKLAGDSHSLMPKSFVKQVIDVAHKQDVYVSTGDWAEDLLRKGPSAFKDYVEKCKRLGFDTIELNIGSLGVPEETLLRLVRLIKSGGLRVKPLLAVKVNKSDIPFGDRAFGAYVVPRQRSSEFVEDVDLKIRRAVEDAAKIAGLNPLRLFHETTATALAYEIYKTDLPESDQLNVAFVDIGHASMQVCIAGFKQGELKVLVHSFDLLSQSQVFSTVALNSRAWGRFLFDLIKLYAGIYAFNAGNLLAVHTSGVMVRKAKLVDDYMTVLAKMHTRSVDKEWVTSNVSMINIIITTVCGQSIYSSEQHVKMLDVGVSFLSSLLLSIHTLIKRAATSITQSLLYHNDYQVEMWKIIHVMVSEVGFLIVLFGKLGIMEIEDLGDTNYRIDDAASKQVTQFLAFNMCIVHYGMGQTGCADVLSCLLDVSEVLSKLKSSGQVMDESSEESSADKQYHCEGAQNLIIVKDSSDVIAAQSAPPQEVNEPPSAVETVEVIYGGVVEQGGYALLKWENLPPNVQIDISLHHYHNQIQASRLKMQPDKKLVRKAVKLALDDLNPKLLCHFAFGAKAVLNPMAAMFGGIFGQEIVKACSGKFHPLFQFFYFGRYDAQISVFGSKLQKKLEDAKVFMVGSGALGCELLINVALMGVSCGDQGKLTINDDDVIEKSNLSRQFPFTAESDNDQFGGSTEESVKTADVHTFLQHLVTFGIVKDDDLDFFNIVAVPDEHMENLVYYLAELGMMQYYMFMYCPSMLAASAVYVARCTLKKSPAWCDPLKLHTVFSESYVET